MSENRKMTARDTALEVLMQVERANAWSDGSLKRTIAKMGWRAGRLPWPQDLPMA